MGLILFPTTFLQGYRDVAGALAHEVRAAAGPRQVALEGGALAYFDRLDEERVFEHVVVVHGVRFGTLQQFQHRLGRALIGEAQDVLSLLDILAADEVGHQARLLRGDPQHAQRGLSLRSHAQPFPECERKLRVGENSPSLCPTMVSWTNTGTCWRPL